MFQSLIELSLEQDTITFPFGFTLTSFTYSLCPTNLYGRIDDLKFQTITVPSADPETTYLRFGLKATFKTASLCPLKDRFKDGSPAACSI